jgi:hypothetical protein
MIKAALFGHIESNVFVCLKRTLFASDVDVNVIDTTAIPSIWAFKSDGGICHIINKSVFNSFQPIFTDEFSQLSLIGIRDNHQLWSSAMKVFVLKPLPASTHPYNASEPRERDSNISHNRSTSDKHSRGLFLVTT